MFVVKRLDKKINEAVSSGDETASFYICTISMFVRSQLYFCVSV